MLRYCIVKWFCMKIFNLHTKDLRDVDDVKVVAYDEYDKNGKSCSNKYVQYTIISARPWTDCMPIRDFKRLNPKIKLAGLN